VYTVAQENLGTNFGLLAASALLLDYVLNVAVAISAGVGALSSAFPSLHKYTLILCLVILVLVTLANLRGTAEAGIAFSIPTYLFIALRAGDRHRVVQGGAQRREPGAGSAAATSFGRDVGWR
jgi:amino acid transporter